MKLLDKLTRFNIHLWFNFSYYVDRLLAHNLRVQTFGLTPF